MALHLCLFCSPDQGCHILEQSLSHKLLFTADSAFSLPGSQRGFRLDGDWSGAVLIPPESVWTLATDTGTSTFDPAQPFNHG